MKNRTPPLLSKSKYMNGLQCPKLLWYQYNRKEEIPPVDPATQAIFDQGTLVGLLAQQLYPDGIKLERDPNPQKHAEQSLKVISLRKPVFEAGLIYENTYALADILNPIDGNKWDLTEVKSSTEVKEEYYYDVAFQKYVYESAGLKIRKCYLLHINNQYIRHGVINPKELFSKVDITEQVEGLKSLVPQRVEGMLKIISQKDVPDIKIGPYCSVPYECVLQEICWKFLPEKDSVFVLYRGKKLAFSLLDKKIQSLAEIPLNTKLTDNQMVQLKVHRTGKPHVDNGALRQFMNGLHYPLYFLDFETILPAVPLFDLSRPYERIPFQFSLFILPKEGAKPEHYTFLSKSKDDPRPELLKRLKDLLGNTGSIVAYNASFEIGTLENSCEAFTEYQSWFDGIQPRFADLLVPFRQFDYYHPVQQGSASIKAVLPALTGKGYEGLDIVEGGMASLEYARVTFDDNISQKERQRVYASLEKYCNLDTQGMVDLLNALRILVT